MKIRPLTIWMGVLAAGAVIAGPALSQHHETAMFDDAGHLLRPVSDAWPAVSVSYSAGDSAMMAAGGEDDSKKAEKANPGDFHVIRVNPMAYAQYQMTGEFPEGTIFTTSFYSLTDNGMTGVGRFWGDKVTAIEAGVKDSQRFDDGWGYFRFEGDAKTADAQPKERCFDCHQTQGATDNVFTQLYAAFKE